MENFYQGSKDVFLTKVRADFDTVEDQAIRAVSSLEKNGLLRSDVNTEGLFTQVSNITDEGNRAVWRHVSTSGIERLGTREAGALYPIAQFYRGWETAVVDPNLQDAAEIPVPEERLDAEAAPYKQALNRAQKLIIETRRKNMGDPFDVFNQAFVAPTSYANTHFVAKGNQGLDGNFTALNEALIIGQNAGVTNGHRLAYTNAASTTGGINGVSNSATWAAFNDTYYYAGLELATTFVDDVGKPMPMFGGMVTIVVPNANSLVRTAQELNKSEWKVGTANNEVNVLMGTMQKIVSSPFLTNSINYTTANTQNRKWFMVDTASQDPQVGTGLVRVAFVPTQSRVDRRQENDAIVYKVKQSYSYVWTDWRNVIGSLGTGSIS